MTKVLAKEFSRAKIRVNSGLSFGGWWPGSQRTVRAPS